MVRIGSLSAKRMIDDKKMLSFEPYRAYAKNILKHLSALSKTILSFLKKQAFAVKMFFR